MQSRDDRTKRMERGQKQATMGVSLNKEKGRNNGPSDLPIDR